MKLKKWLLIPAFAVYSVALAVLFYFLGVRRDPVGTDAPWKSYPQTFYAVITEIRDDSYLVDGLEVNDVNFRDEFSFSISPETILEWRGVPITPEDLEVGDTISISFPGYVLEIYPAIIPEVDAIRLLDDTL